MPSIEIVGPSGAGKSTLMNALIMYGEGAVRARLSTTTRAARTSGHVPGEYWHVSEALLDHLNEPTQRKLAWVVGAHGARYATQCTALQASLENGAMTSVVQWCRNALNHRTASQNLLVSKIECVIFGSKHQKKCVKHVCLHVEMTQKKLIPALKQNGLGQAWWPILNARLV